MIRAGVAGAAATLIDLAVLALLVSIVHLDPHVANVPALVAGGIANFLGNRHFAFRAANGSLARQAALYTIVEAIALALNGVLFDLALHTHAPYWVLRLVTSHVVFLCWSYPLWRTIFKQRVRADAAPDPQP